MRFRGAALPTVLVVFAALTLGACGGSDGASGSTADLPTGDRLTVYSSLALQGESRVQTLAIMQGIRLALHEAGGMAGGRRIRYVALDDSSAEEESWMPELAAANARRAVLDPDAIAYIGEFESRASAVTIPILNAADLAQVSPSNTYVGLTTAEPGSTKGEPDKYYPTGRRTFVRLVPRDTIQGAALVSQLAGDGCSRPALVHGDESYGAGLSRILEEQGRAAGITFVADLSAGSRPLELQSQARGLAKLGADCVVYTGLPGSVARGLLVAAAAALPAARLYGSDGLCQPGFTDPSIGGLPAAVGARFRCTLPTVDLREIPGGAAFLDAFRARYGPADPDPYAVYGYEAMRLILDQISAGYTTRGSLTRSLLQVRGRRSVLGTYSVKRSGDTTLTDYGLYRVGSDGLPTFERTIHQAP